MYYKIGHDNIYILNFINYIYCYYYQYIYIFMNVECYEKCCHILAVLKNKWNHTKNKEEKDSVIIEWLQNHISAKNLTFDRYQFEEKGYRRIIIFDEKNHQWTREDYQKWIL